MDKYVDFAALGQALLASIIGGAGIVAIFSVGLVALSEREGAMATGGHSGGRTGNPAWLVVAVLCFALVIAGVALGVYVLLDK